jgi:ABC-type sulfate/molybdate transport systems ATPase subunit
MTPASSPAADGGLSVRATARLRRRGAGGGFSLDVAFEAPPGIVALIGPSGSGKTLTLRVIAGLLHPDAGRVACAGRVLLDTAAGVDLPARARRVGYVFQQFALFPHLTVAANVGYGLHDVPRAAREGRVAELLALVGLTARARHLPRELSGGEQQRAALARALAPAPLALLLDEPFSAVDAPRRAELRAAVREAHARTRVPTVLVTHDPADAVALADTVVLMEDGRVTAAGAPRELLAPAAAPFPHP